MSSLHAVATIVRRFSLPKPRLPSLLRIPEAWLGSVIALGFFVVLERIAVLLVIIGFDWSDDWCAWGVWLWIIPLACLFFYMLAIPIVWLVRNERMARVLAMILVLPLLLADSINFLTFVATGQYFSQRLDLCAACNAGAVWHVLSEQWQPVCLSVSVAIVGILLSFIGYNIKPRHAFKAAWAVAAMLVPACLWIALPIFGVRYYPASADWAVGSIQGIPPSTCRIWSMHQIPDGLPQAWKRFRATAPMHDLHNEIPADKKRPVALIIMESFRADALNPRWMPETWKHLNHAIVFNRHMSTGNCTEAGMYGILAGNYWWSQHTHRMKSPDELCWTRDFSKDGYACHASFSCVGVFFPGDPASWKWMGLETFFNTPAFQNFATFFGNGSEDDNDACAHDHAALQWVVKQAENGEKKGETPAIVTFLYGMHLPYYSPLPPATLDDAEKDTAVPISCRDLARYKSAVRHFDQELGHVLPVLLAKGYEVILTGDHAESFGKDHCLVHDNGVLSCGQSHVPLVIFSASLRPQTVDACTSHIQLKDLLVEAMISGSVKTVPGACSFVWRKSGAGMWDFGPNKLLHIETGEHGEVTDAFFSNDNNKLISIPDEEKKRCLRRIDMMGK